MVKYSTKPHFNWYKVLQCFCFHISNLPFRNLFTVQSCNQSTYISNLLFSAHACTHHTHTHCFVPRLTSLESRMCCRRPSRWKMSFISGSIWLMSPLPLELGTAEGNKGTKLSSIVHKSRWPGYISRSNVGGFLCQLNYYIFWHLEKK